LFRFGDVFATLLRVQHLGDIARVLSRESKDVRCPNDVADGAPGPVVDDEAVLRRQMRELQRPQVRG
jgi:hypothetical protein